MEGGVKFNLLRRDSGDLRLLVVSILSIICGFFLWGGYKLMVMGATGQWEIVSSFNGWSLYITSISPGLFVMGLGAAVIIWGLPETLKNL